MKVQLSISYPLISFENDQVLSMFVGHTRQFVLGMCGTDFFLFRFGFVKKTRIWFGMSLVPFGSKKRSSLMIL